MEETIEEQEFKEEVWEIIADIERLVCGYMEKGISFEKIAAALLMYSIGYAYQHKDPAVASHNILKLISSKLDHQTHQTMHQEHSPFKH